MALLNELGRLIEEYRSGSVSLDDFVEKFEPISRVMFSEGRDLVDACLTVENALSCYSSSEMTEVAFAKELAAAVHPFAPLRADVNYKPHLQAFAFAAAAVLALAIVPGNTSPSPDVRQLQISDGSIETWSPLKQTSVATASPVLKGYVVT